MRTKQPVCHESCPPHSYLLQKRALALHESPPFSFKVEVLYDNHKGPSWKLGKNKR